MSSQEGPSNQNKIVDDATPAHPFLESRFALVQATVEMTSALDDTDASFTPGTETLSQAKPFLPLIFNPFGSPLSRLGQADLRNLCRLRCRFIDGGIHAAIRRHQLRRMPNSGAATD